MGPVAYRETSVEDYQYTDCNIPEGADLIDVVAVAWNNAQKGSPRSSDACRLMALALFKKLIVRILKNLKFRNKLPFCQWV
jgi:hypothetical protein